MGAGHASHNKTRKWLIPSLKRHLSSMAAKIFCTSFCNHGHRLVDGKPIDHECFVLPTEALLAEQAGDNARALEVMGAWKKRRVHKGLKPSV